MKNRGFAVGWAVWLVAVLIIIAAIGYFMAEDYLYPSEDSSEATTTTSLPPAQLTQDVYPLYGNVQWGSPQAENIAIGTTSVAGESITSATVSAGMDPSAVFTPFENYYDTKLKAAGWDVANDLAAGGHTGGQTGYRKDGAVILTRFNIVYHTNHPDAPSECPCDVTLSLFSGK